MESSPHSRREPETKKCSGVLEQVPRQPARRHRSLGLAITYPAFGVYAVGKVRSILSGLD
jgi:hypothetical protein